MSNDNWHGTLNGYNRHACRCEKCVQYKRDYNAARQRRITRNPPILNTDDPRHGTANGYSNLKCRCERCRAAWGTTTRQRREERNARIPDYMHGTDNCYVNWKCRCEKCLAAHLRVGVKSYRSRLAGVARSVGRPRRDT